MASRQQIKRRITSVRNTRQITRAMQMVAASRLRKAQEAVVKPREYSALAKELLVRLRHSAAHRDPNHLFTPRTVKKRLLIVISSDLGLAGAYDSNVFREFTKELQKDRDNGVESSVICIGKKVSHFATKLSKITVLGVYPGLTEHIDADRFRPLLLTAITAFTEKRVDKVSIIYTHFKSTIVQDVRVQQLLPAGFEKDTDIKPLNYVTLEPSVDELVRVTTTRLLEVQILQSLLDAAASEQSMKMLAMKNATDNASDLISDLTLEFNTARQAAITQELAEITGGAEAMK